LDPARSIGPTDLRGLARARWQYCHGDFLGNEQRREGFVVGITENELQNMFTRWELKAGLGLSRAKVNVLFIGWDWFAWLNRLVYIDKEMVMTGIRRSVACMGDTHVAQPEPNREAASDPLSVARIDNIERGVRWGRCLRLSRPR